MSSQTQQPNPAASTPLRLEVTGEQYFAPTLAPADVKKANYYTHSGLPPLGKFRKGHELYLIGDVMLRSWGSRSYKDSLAEKEVELERCVCVVGQVSRGMEGYTASILTKQTIEYRDQTQQRRGGILGRLGL